MTTTKCAFAADTSTSNPSTCTAMNENGPAECKFPFKNFATGAVHNECTDEGYEGRGILWCATELEADGLTHTGEFAICCCPDCPSALAGTTDPSTTTELAEEQGAFLLYYCEYNGNFAKLKDDPMPDCMDGEVNHDFHLISPALFMGPGG